jgi:hypothetical protein
MPDEFLASALFAFIIIGFVTMPFTLFSMGLCSIFIVSKVLTKRNVQNSHLAISIIYLIVTLYAIWHSINWVTINDSGSGNAGGFTLMLWMNIPGAFSIIYMIYYIKVIRRNSKRST